MGKVSPISIKYTIFAKFSADGPVEKPDVIGAIFGQTEGLLGDDLELRDLQKNGKIGRIEVDIETKDSKAKGMIEIPTSLDKTETTIIAAAIETIDRVGPCSAKVSIDKIDDVRGSKRDYVLERAKKLLEKMDVPDAKEMHLTVSNSVKTGQIVEYGDEKLPAGPDVENENLIVVEGRADVINLLGYGFKNVIGMNGASLPKTISELSQNKNITLFVDGDRGGDLIIKDALQNAHIDYIAKAPEGQEVEELTGKGINISLRAKQKVEDYLKGEKPKRSYSRRSSETNERRSYRTNSREREPRRNTRTYSRSRYDKPDEERPPVKLEKVEPANEDEKFRMHEVLSEIEGSGAACLLDDKLKIFKKTSGKELSGALRRSRGVHAVVFDGLVTNAIISAAEQAGCKRVVAKNFSSIGDTNLELISL